MKTEPIAEWYGVSLDIDDEMRAQEALRDRERELSQLVDMVPVNIGVLTPDGEPTFFNKRMLDFLGLDDVAALGQAGHEPAGGSHRRPSSIPMMQPACGTRSATPSPPASPSP